VHLDIAEGGEPLLKQPVFRRRGEEEELGSIPFISAEGHTVWWLLRANSASGDGGIQFFMPDDLQASAELEGIRVA
jgi:hypothetical protein